MLLCRGAFLGVPCPGCKTLLPIRTLDQGGARRLFFSTFCSTRRRPLGWPALGTNKTFFGWACMYCCPKRGCTVCIFAHCAEQESWLRVFD